MMIIFSISSVNCVDACAHEEYPSSSPPLTMINWSMTMEVKLPMTNLMMPPVTVSTIGLSPEDL